MMLLISCGVSSLDLKMEKGLEGWRVQSHQTCTFAPPQMGRVFPCKGRTSSFSGASAVLSSLGSCSLQSHNCYKIALWDPRLGVNFFSLLSRKRLAGNGNGTYIVAEMQCCHLEGTHLHSDCKSYIFSHFKDIKWLHIHSFLCHLSCVWSGVSMAKGLFR